MASSSVMEVAEEGSYTDEWLRMSDSRDVAFLAKLEEGGQDPLRSISLYRKRVKSDGTFTYIQVEPSGARGSASSRSSATNASLINAAKGLGKPKSDDIFSKLKQAKKEISQASIQIKASVLDAYGARVSVNKTTKQNGSGRTIPIILSKRSLAMRLSIKLHPGRISATGLKVLKYKGPAISDPTSLVNFVKAGMPVLGQYFVNLELHMMALSMPMHPAEKGTRVRLTLVGAFPQQNSPEIDNFDVLGPMEPFKIRPYRRSWYNPVYRGGRGSPYFRGNPGRGRGFSRGRGTGFRGPRRYGRYY